MNIFYLDTDPQKCAQYMVDKHVVKMILETAQLLSTAHRVLDGTEVVEQKWVNGSLPARYRKVKRWKLSDEREDVLYQATHMNHPSAVWCRENHQNYTWLFHHFLSLIAEYGFRYGKDHKCIDMVNELFNPPNNIPMKAFTPVTPAMAPEYLVSKDSIENYRNYYKRGKTHLHKWTKRNPPEWINTQVA